jgi:hypothetical protein
MSYLSDISLRRGIGLLVLVLAMLLGGTWATVEVTIDHLLNQSAKDTARNWAAFLAANVTDLDKIAAGEQPSATSLAFFQATRKAGEVFRYVIFNREGYSQLVSDRDGTELVSLSEYSAEAARAAATGQLQCRAISRKLLSPSPSSAGRSPSSPRMSTKPTSAAIFSTTSFWPRSPCVY